MASVPGTIYQSFAGAGATQLVRAHAVELRSLLVTSVNAAGIRYIQLWDRILVPTGGLVGAGPEEYGAAGGLTRVVSFPVPAGTATAPAYLELGADVFGDGLPFRNGLAWAFSTVPQTFTAGTAADHSVTLRYRDI